MGIVKQYIKWNLYETQAKQILNKQVLRKGYLSHEKRF